MVGRYFLSVCSLSFHALKRVFCRAKVLDFDETKADSFPPQNDFFFMGRAFGVISKNSSPSLRSQRISTMLSSPSFIVLHFYI